MSELDDLSNFEGFYIEANQSISIEGTNIEILANEPGLRYLRYLIEKLLESSIDGKHFQLDKTTGLDGNIKSLVFTRKLLS